MENNDIQDGENARKSSNYSQEEVEVIVEDEAAAQ